MIPINHIHTEASAISDVVHWADMSYLPLVSISNLHLIPKSHSSPTNLCCFSAQPCFSFVSLSLLSNSHQHHVCLHKCLPVRSAGILLSLNSQPRVTKCQPGLFAAAICTAVESQSSVLCEAPYVEQLWKKVGGKAGSGERRWMRGLKDHTSTHWKAGFLLCRDGHRGKSDTWKCRKIGHIYISEVSCQLKM